MAAKDQTAKPLSYTDTVDRAFSLIEEVRTLVNELGFPSEANAFAQAPLVRHVNLCLSMVHDALEELAGEEN